MGYSSVSALCFVIIGAMLLVGVVPWWMRSSIDKKRNKSDQGLMHIVKIEAELVERETKGKQTEQPAPKKKLTQQQINRARALRRAAIKRRQILVISLLVVTVVVAILSFILQFSVLYTLIPLCFVAIVLGLGFRASQVARAWEQDLNSRTSNLPSSSHSVDHPKGLTTPLKKSALQSKALADKKNAVKTPAEDNAPTYIIPVSDVRAVLKKQGITTPSKQVKRKSVKKDTPVNRRGNEEKKSLKQATASNLVSFSLGDQHNDADYPQSMEIKSYRSVAKAKPVSPAERQAIFEDVTPSIVSLKSVDIPEPSDESLGMNVDSILSRRQH